MRTTAVPRKQGIWGTEKKSRRERVKHLHAGNDCFPPVGADPLHLKWRYKRPNPTTLTVPKCKREVWTLPTVRFDSCHKTGRPISHHKLSPRRMGQRSECPPIRARQAQTPEMTQKSQKKR